MTTYLDALHERVVIFDGATGTNLQLRELGPDDFGGPALEGCNELLCDTRPDVIADLHRSFFDVGVDVVETDSFGSLPWVLAEYGIAHRTRELAVKSARIAREVASGYRSRTAGATPGWRARSGRGPSWSRSGRSPSPTCATATPRRPRGCWRAASTCSSSRPARTCCR